MLFLPEVVMASLCPRITAGAFLLVRITRFAIRATLTFNKTA